MVKKVLFENEFFNPFLLINEKDLTKTETEGKYLLNPNKVDLFSYYLFSNKTPLTELAFEFKGENFDKITAISKEYEGVFLDKNSQSYIPVKYFYETDVLLSNIGETSIEGLKPVASRDKERETILKNALSEITGNYTIIINEHDRESHQIQILIQFGILMEKEKFIINNELAMNQEDMIFIIKLIKKHMEMKN